MKGDDGQEEKKLEEEEKKLGEEEKEEEEKFGEEEKEEEEIRSKRENDVFSNDLWDATLDEKVDGRKVGGNKNGFEQKQPREEFRAG